MVCAAITDRIPYSILPFVGLYSILPGLGVCCMVYSPTKQRDSDSISHLDSGGKKRTALKDEAARGAGVVGAGLGRTGLVRAVRCCSSRR